MGNEHRIFVTYFLKYTPILNMIIYVIFVYTFIFIKYTNKDMKNTKLICLLHSLFSAFTDFVILVDVTKFDFYVSDILDNCE